LLPVVGHVSMQGPLLLCLSLPSCLEEDKVWVLLINQLELLVRPAKQG
jgi:hypothetical protein